MPTNKPPTSLLAPPPSLSRSRSTPVLRDPVQTNRSGLHDGPLGGLDPQPPMTLVPTSPTHAPASSPPLTTADAKLIALHLQSVGDRCVDSLHGLEQIKEKILEKFPNLRDDVPPVTAGPRVSRETYLEVIIAVVIQMLYAAENSITVQPPYTT